MEQNTSVLVISVRFSVTSIRYSVLCILCPGCAEIGLWESRKGTTKDICHCRGSRIIDINRDKGRFVVVNGETSCQREIFENVLEHMHGGNVASGENQGIICILEHRTRKRGIYRMIELDVHGCTTKRAFEGRQRQ